MVTVLIVIHIMLVLALIGLVLMQRSEGGALGIGGGGGGGGGFMSARGAADALTKSTTIVAAGFFLTSIALGIVSHSNNRTGDVLRQLDGTTSTAPAVPGGETDGTAAPSGGNLLEDLEREGQPVAPTTGVPTSE